MTQQLPPPPAGFSAQPPQQQTTPPPPAGFSAQPVQQPAQQDTGGGFLGQRWLSKEEAEEMARVIGENRFSLKRELDNLSLPEQRGIMAGIESTSPVLGKIMGSILGLGRRTPEAGEAESLVDAPISDVGFKVGLNLATNFNQEEIEQVLTNEFGADALTKDQAGNTFVEVNGKKYIVNKPGLSKQDLAASLGNALAFLPSSRAAALFTTIGKRLGVGALTSGLTQAAIEGGQAATGGEFSGSEVAAATVLGGLGEIPSAIVASRRLTPGAAQLLPDVTDAEAAMARQFREETGVSLLPSQASDSQKDQLVNFLLFQDPQTSKQMGARLKEQSRETYNGLTSFLDELASTDDAARAALDVRNLSESAIAESARARTKETKPMFKDAFKAASDSGVIIDSKPITKNLAEIADTQSGGVKRQINQLRGVIGEASQLGNQKTNFEKLHNAKKEIDRLIAAGTKGDKPTMDAFTEGVYKDTRKQINDILRENSEAYAAANDRFIELSPAVEALESGVGDISKISDSKLSQVSSQIFNLNEFIANPEGFNSAKRIIKNSNPDAWTALTRSRFQQDLAEVGVDSIDDALDSNVNVIQQIWSKSFKGKEKTLFKEALDGDQRKNYEALAEVFNRTRKRPAQSATEQLAQLRESLEGNRNVAKAVDAIMNPNSAGIFEKVFGSQQVRQRNTKILADVITDPKWMDRMSEIRKLGMETPKGGAAFIQLFRDALNEEAETDAGN